MAYIKYEITRDRTTPFEAILPIDAVVTEEHEVTAVATQHPVEEGQPISDYVLPSAFTLRLSARISNAPILVDPVFDSPLLVHAQANGAVQPNLLLGTASQQLSSAKVSGGFVQPYKPPGFSRYAAPVTVTPAVRGEQTVSAGGTILKFPQKVDRVSEYWDVLKGVIRDGFLCTVYTDLNIYEAMVMTALSVPRDGTDAVTFDMTFMSVRYASTVESQLVKLRKVRTKEIRQVPTKTEFSPSFTESPEQVQARVRTVAESAVLWSIGDPSQSVPVP